MMPISNIEESTMNYASVGSISHGTLRTEDLLDAFANELEYQVKRQPMIDGLGLAERKRLLGLAKEAQEIDADSDDAGELVDALQDELEAFAPPYCYFGAHEGDGSDFGYWPCVPSIEELPRVKDSDEAKELGEDCIYVNDHGNVTVYGGDGSVILELV